MVKMENLPTEIVCLVADMCTFGVHPQKGKLPSSYAVFHAYFARTSRRFCDILNPTLYKRNLTRDAPLDSCVLWAAQQGRLETMKVAYKYGANLDSNGTRTEQDLYNSIYEIPGRLRFIATPLHIAIQNGHRDVVEYLLANDADIHVPSRHFCSSKKVCQCKDDCPRFPYALHIAVVHENGVKDAAAMLIKAGAYLVAEDEILFPIAAENGYNELVEPLLDLKEPSTTAAGLRYAAKTEDLALFSRISEHSELNAAAPDKEGQTALHFAAMTGNILFVKPLVERPEVVVDAANQNGTIPLHLAAASGNLATFKLLLQHSKVEKTTTDKEGSAALHYAASAGKREIVEYLLELGIHAGTKNGKGQTAFHLAAASEKLDMTGLFLHRSDIDVADLDADDRSALHYACQIQKEPEVMIPFIEELVEAGVPVNALAIDGTALFYSVKHHNFEVALALLRLGADPLLWQGDSFQWTLLHHCLYSSGPKQTELVREFITRGVDVDTVTDYENEDGERHMLEIESCGSPLFFAAVYAQNIDCMKLLLEAGADADSAVVFCGWHSDEDLQEGEQQPFISALFRHVLRTTCIQDCDVEKVEERLALLLQHGSSLEAEESRSPLEWACEAAVQYGSLGLLTFLLEKASSDHISAKHLAEQIKVADDHEHSEEVVRILVEFKERIYPGVDVDLSAENSEEEEGSEEEDDGEEGDSEEEGSEEGEGSGGEEDSEEQHDSEEGQDTDA